MYNNRSKNLSHGQQSLKTGPESEAPVSSDAFQTSGNSPTLDLIYVDAIVHGAIEAGLAVL